MFFDLLLTKASELHHIRFKAVNLSFTLLFCQHRQCRGRVEMFGGISEEK